MFVPETGGRGVFFLGVQKYFVKMAKTWSNFKKARDARTRRSVLGGMYKKNAKKMPKIEKIPIFGPKKHPLKVSSATWTGVFCPPHVECFRSETPPHFDLCLMGGGELSPSIFEVASFRRFFFFATFCFT